MRLDTVKIPKNGFLYIYVSNETQNWDVFFDNLSVQHFSGPMLEETHYYPFGLTMAGISSKAYGRLENRKRYNGIEQTTELDLNQYDAFYRTLDPQIGRFLQIDPKLESAEAWSAYSAMLDNPIRYADPLGDSAVKPFPAHIPSPSSNPTLFLAPSLWYGYASIKGAEARVAYNEAASKFDPNDKDSRVKLKEATRTNTTPEPFNSAIEKARPMASEKSKANDPGFKGSANKTNAEFNEFAKNTGNLGRIFMAGAAVVSGYNIATGSDPGKQTIVEISIWTLAIEGGTVGAQIGSAGGPVGAFVGGLVGSVGAGVGGSKLGTWIAENSVVGEERYMINGSNYYQLMKR